MPGDKPVISLERERPDRYLLIWMDVVKAKAVGFTHEAEAWHGNQAQKTLHA
jgi:hypothetical protein